jgi:hypothetical protein
MATTFHTVNFKNKTIDMLTGITAATTPIGFVNAYNGVQAADPSAVPAGAFVFAAATSGPNLNTQMSFSGQGVSQLATPRGPTTPANALTTSTITTARIFTTASAAIIDVVATLGGGGGGIILDTLNAVAGVGYTVTAFSLKLPLNNGGTLSMNAPLVDRLVDLWGGASSTVPEMGKNTNGQCLFQVYTGAAPASADLPATGTLLVSTTHRRHEHLGCCLGRLRRARVQPSVDGGRLGHGGLRAAGEEPGGLPVHHPGLGRNSGDGFRHQHHGYHERRYLGHAERSDRFDLTGRGGDGFCTTSIRR